MKITIKRENGKYIRTMVEEISIAKLELGVSILIPDPRGSEYGNIAIERLGMATEVYQVSFIEWNGEISWTVTVFLGQLEQFLRYLNV